MVGWIFGNMTLTFKLISIFSMLHNILQILCYYYSIWKYSHFIGNLYRRLVVFFLLSLKGQSFTRSKHFSPWHVLFMIKSVIKLSTSWGQFLSFIFSILSIKWILRPLNHFQIVYKLNFHTLCLSFVGFGSMQSIFSMRYIYRDLVFHLLHRFVLHFCFGST